MLSLIVSETAQSPIYQQIFDQVISQILKGELKTGELLPPIRTVAKELRISVITVKKAWEELERKGFINSMVGRGCFVAELTKKEIAQKRGEMVNERFAKEVAFYKGLGVSLEEMIEIIKKYYQAPL